MSTTQSQNETAMIKEQIENNIYSPLILLRLLTMLNIELTRI